VAKIRDRLGYGGLLSTLSVPSALLAEIQGYQGQPEYSHAPEQTIALEYKDICRAWDKLCALPYDVCEQAVRHVRVAAPRQWRMHDLSAECI
jgi:hypothetical protein